MAKKKEQNTTQKIKNWANRPRLRTKKQVLIHPSCYSC